MNNFMRAHVAMAVTSSVTFYYYLFLNKDTVSRHILKMLSYVMFVSWFSTVGFYVSTDSNLMVMMSVALMTNILFYVEDSWFTPRMVVIAVCQGIIPLLEKDTHLQYLLLWVVIAMLLSEYIRYEIPLVVYFACILAMAPGDTNIDHAFKHFAFFFIHVVVYSINKDSMDNQEMLLSLLILFTLTSGTFLHYIGALEDHGIEVITNIIQIVSYHLIDFIWRDKLLFVLFSSGPFANIILHSAGMHKLDLDYIDIIGNPEWKLSKILIPLLILSLHTTYSWRVLDKQQILFNGVAWAILQQSLYAYNIFNSEAIGNFFGKSKKQ